MNKAISILLASHIFTEVLWYPIYTSWVFRPGNKAYSAIVGLGLIWLFAMLLMAAALKAKVRQCIEFIYTETYWNKCWRENYPKDMLLLTMKKVAVEFIPGYDVDHAFLGLVSILSPEQNNTKHSTVSFA